MMETSVHTRQVPLLFLCYPRCSSCAKARQWLQNSGIAYIERDIKEERPSKEELVRWQKASGMPLKRFFNTSGQAYRNGKYAKRVPEMTENEQFEHLAADGMLVKRPLLVGAGFVLVGFKEEEWAARLL